MENKNYNKYQKVTSLALASALLAWGFPIARIEKSNPRKAIFFYKNSPELQDALQSFWENTKTVLPTVYFDAIRQCKSRIYSED